jgi:DNA adenine methylase
LAQLEPYFPTHFRQYVEPFVGGGAVFFHLHNQGRLGKRAILVDRVEELINCYRVIQSQVDTLIAELRRHEPGKTDPHYYYQVREWDRASGYAQRSDVERAARFLFLNHTCYNGLYRVNRRGLFNVPFGRYQNPTICNAEHLRLVNRALQDVTLLAGDFERCLDWTGSEDLVYLDPPYHPLTDTAKFTSYTSHDFGIQEQQRLATLFRELDRRGCHVILSNSDTDTIRKLYHGYRQVQMQARRTINSKGNKRGTIAELLVVNA